jgi:hypothetical protein
MSGAGAAAHAEAAQLPVRAHAKLITEAARDNTVTVRAAAAACASAPLTALLGQPARWRLSRR